MKRNTVYLLIAVLAVVAIAVWYFMKPNPRGFCEKDVRENPNTKKLEVRCLQGSCTRSCILQFRRKRTEDKWQQPSDSHTFDTARLEYRCLCR